MPIGPATSMAIVVIRSVPANSGTAPNEPDEPTWSARSAVCGLHCRPNRNSVTGTCWKKRIDSNSTENTMPAVVAIETAAASQKAAVTQRSTRLRARKSLVTWRRALATPTAARADAGDQQGDPAEGQQGAVVGGRLLERRRDLAGRRQAPRRALHGAHEEAGISGPGRSASGGAGARPPSAGPGAP